MDNHDFCRAMLKDARQEHKTIKIPTISSAKLSDEHYAVFLGDDWYDEYGACCAFYARWEAINDFASSEKSALNQSCELREQERGQSPPQ